METLDDKLIKSGNETIPFWKIVLWPIGIGFLVGGLISYCSASLSHHYFARDSGSELYYSLYQTVIVVTGAERGMITGLVIAIIFVAIYSLKYKRKGSWRQLKKRYLKAAGLSALLWFLAGSIGAFLCYENPIQMSTFFTKTDPRLEILQTIPLGDLVRFGFVAFSVWGVWIGGITGVSWAIWDTLRSAS